VSRLADLFTQHAVQPLLVNTHSLIVLIKSDGKLIEWNAAFDGFAKPLSAATKLQDFIVPESRLPFSRLLKKVIREGKSRRGSLKLNNGGGQAACDCWFVPVPDGYVMFFAEFVAEKVTEEIAKLSLDLQRTRHALDSKQTELQAVMAQVDEIAHTDQLTFLSNHRQIVGDLQREVFNSDRTRRPLSISMVDIDHFKRVNDTIGHTAGDEVLRVLASRMRDGIRHSDMIGRYGGEEFLIILPGTPVKSAMGQAERLIKLVRGLTVKVNRQALQVTVSIGVAQYRVGKENWEEFLDRADKALYQAKEQGRDRWCVSKVKKQPARAGPRSRMQS
jgi:diguanylate cyclase (GGDEF)-like protein